MSSSIYFWYQQNENYFEYLLSKNFEINMILFLNEHSQWTEHTDPLRCLVSLNKLTDNLISFEYSFLSDGWLTNTIDEKKSKDKSQSQKMCK